MCCNMNQIDHLGLKLIFDYMTINLYVFSSFMKYWFDPM